MSNLLDWGMRFNDGTGPRRIKSATTFAPLLCRARVRVESPAGGVAGKILFSPGQNRARANRVKNALRDNHERHLVFGARRSVQLLESGLVSEIHLRRLSFDDDHVVARFEVDGKRRIPGQVPGLARTASRTEVESPVKPESPNRDGVGAAIRANGANPVVSSAGETLFGVTKRQVLMGSLESVQRRHLRQPDFPASRLPGLGRRSFLQRFGAGHKTLPGETFAPTEREPAHPSCAR